MIGRVGGGRVNICEIFDTTGIFRHPSICNCSKERRSSALRIVRGKGPKRFRCFTEGNVVLNEELDGKLKQFGVDRRHRRVITLRR